MNFLINKKSENRITTLFSEILKHCERRDTYSLIHLDISHNKIDFGIEVLLLMVSFMYHDVRFSVGVITTYHLIVIF